METILLIASKFAVPIILALITPAINRLLKLLENRYQIKVTDDQRRQLIDLAKGAVASAEEFAASKKKHTEETVTGKEKLTLAADQIMRQKGNQLSRAEAEELVHSVLGMNSGPGAGASGEKFIA